MIPWQKFSILKAEPQVTTVSHIGGTNMKKRSVRANFTIPDDVADIFNWLLKYDGRFKSDASVAAFLIREGALKVYNESFNQGTRFEPEDE
jgi:hypothetical protein